MEINQPADGWILPGAHRCPPPSPTAVCLSAAAKNKGN